MVAAHEDNLAVDDVNERTNFKTQSCKDPEKSKEPMDITLADSKNQPNSGSSNSETQHDKDLVYSKIHPMNDLENSETKRDKNSPGHEIQSDNEPTNSGVQSISEFTCSEVQAENNMANSEKHPNDDLPNFETKPNNEPAISETQPNDNLPSSERQPHKKPDTSEAQPIDDLPNSERQPENEPATFDTQPNDDPPNSGTQPENEPATFDTQPSDDLPNSKTQPEKDPVIDTQPNDVLANSETLPDKEPASFETQPYNDLSNSETQANSELASFETQPNSDFPNSEIQPDNEPASVETQPYNDLPNFETQPDKEPASFQTQPKDDLSNSNIQPAHETASTEMQPNNNLPNAETQQGDEPAMANSETQPEDDISNSKTQPANDPASFETPPNDDLHNMETQSHQEPTDFKAQPNDEPTDSEMQDMNDQADSEMQDMNDQANSEKQLNHGVPDSDFKPSDGFLDSEMQPGNKVADAEMISETELVTSKAPVEMHSHNEPANIKAQPNNAQADSEMQAMNDQANSEKQPNHGVPSSDSQPSDGFLDTEMQPGNKVADVEMISETELVTSEALAENQLVSSEENQMVTGYQPSNSGTLTNTQVSDSEILVDHEHPHPQTFTYNQLADSGTLSENHLNNFEAMPNQLGNAEVMHDHQLPNSGTLHHSNMVNSEAPGHYELINTESLHNHQLVNTETLHNNQLVNSQTMSNYEGGSSERISGYEIVSSEALANNEARTPETQPNKRRKKKSIVWEHFTIETVSAGCRRAYCNQCKQSFAYSTGSKVAGTSHLKRHIAKGTCPALLRNQAHNPLSPYTPSSRGRGSGSTGDTPKRRYRSPSSPYVIFDQDRCRHEIARMIIMHDYPLHMVEHPGFVAFVQNLQPQFNMVTFNTVQGDCVATYLMEKQNLQKYVEGIPGRVCFTLDMWTSNQSVGYVFITGHFVDSNWKLQKRILNVVMEPYPDSDSALSHAVAACFSDWNLDGRLFSMTTNQQLSEAALENLRPLLSVKNPLILNGQLLLDNCIARTLSSVAKDCFGSAQETIKKIRDSVKYVKTSESHEEKFMELKQQLQVPSEKSLFLDDQTQWNTTYQMLVAASELKEVFICLDTSDPDYKRAPTMDDWKLVETLCTYLKPLYDAAKVLGATTTYPTAITFFHEVWKFQLDLARAVTNEDPFISNLAKIMQEKIDKYWRHCCLALSIAVVMDPRFKMKLVEFSFSKIYGEDAPTYVKIVDDGIHELFHEYVALPLPLTPAYAEEGNNVKMEESLEGTLFSDNGLTDFDAYIMETTSQQMKSELDQYLDESLLPRVPEFDVLGWWKLNRLKYPTLSKMARDILSIPVCTVPLDSVFDTKIKEMDQYRSSLRPETVEALVCAKDWMHYGVAEASNAVVKVDF